MSKIEQLSEALRGSLIANEDLKRLNRQLANASREPIAILATSCRLPGGVANAEALWQLVHAEADGIGPLPLDRGWHLDELLERRGETTEDRGLWQGGFLENADAFDAAFFGISDREALAMDPQQRLLLETTWEVIENAGIVPGSLKKTSTGVFIGTTYQAYVPPIYDMAAELDGYRLQGGLPSMASGRVSYAFGLNGPAVTIDTACSSSLVAVHSAVQSLRAQECSLAIAGGATIVASPEVYVEFARQNGLASDGRCKAFADEADGTAFSEGVGLVLLARLSDAVRSGYPILAVIRGSAINHDGASNGLTAPSGPAQEKVIHRALKNAGLSTGDIDIVEAHGTGTSLGDPIEAHALINTYGQDRPADQPLWLGSIKSNVGHVQAASGVVGLIKMVMALKHGVMPRTLHAGHPSSKIDWSGGAVSLLNEARPWPKSERPRRAAISSFGFSGTNSHVILEQAPEARKEALSQASVGIPVDFPHVLTVSAVTPLALKVQAAQLADYVRKEGNEELADICAALATTRTHFDHRAVCLGSTAEELIASLEALTKGEAAAGLTQGTRHPSEASAFLFSGQGSQWAGMGQQLYRSLPDFAQHLDAVIEALQPHLAQPFKDVLFAPAGSPEAALLDRTDYTQPALFAIEIALYRTLEQLGIRPDYLCGHSIGEIAAAHVAGVFTLEDAARFVVLRGRLMQEISVAGAMLAIEALEAQVLETLSGLEGRVTVGAVNSPNSIVISGDTDAVLEVGEIWKARGARTSRLNVSHAFHSPHIATIVDDLRTLAASIPLKAPAIPIVSTVTGLLLTDEEACSAAYWADQAKLAVRFADAVSLLNKQGVSTYIEIGPDAVLTTLAQTNLATAPRTIEREYKSIALMRRNRSDNRVFAGGLAALHVRGHALDWHHLMPVIRRAGLPNYPFQRKRFWFKRSLANAGRGEIGSPDASHPFLRPGIELADQHGHVFSGRISLSGQEWLLDHAISGQAINAGATTSECILAAGATLGLTRMDNLVLLENLPLMPGGGVEIQLRIGSPNGDGGHPVDVYFRLPNEHDGQGGHTADDAERTWIRHATAKLVQAGGSQPRWSDLTQWPPLQAEAVEFQSLYDTLEERGIYLGPAFRLLTEVWRQGENIYVEAELQEDDTTPSARNQSPTSGFLIHPALLDAGLQASLLQAPTIDGTRQLFSISGLQVYQGNARRIRACVTLKSGGAADAGHSEHSVRIADQDGMPVAEIASVVLRAAEPALRSARKRSVYRPEWLPVSETANLSAPATLWIEPSAEGEARDATVSNVSDALNAIKESDFQLAILVCGEHQQMTAQAASAVTLHIMKAVQIWLADPATTGVPLIILTRNAVDTGEPQVLLNLVQAPLWGLLRSVQWEHPDRIVLLDLDHHGNVEPDVSKVWAAVAQGETQLALREGQLLAARLARHDVVRHEPSVEESEIVAENCGTVLITGAGSLGVLVARRLAGMQRYSAIVLASRRGEDAPGISQLVKELSASDLDVRAVKCDVGNAADLQRLLSSIPADKPLKAIVHTAGISTPVSFIDLNADAVTQIMRPKVDAAWALHELTRDMKLEAFILFSSAVAVIGLGNQSHYGAANAFLDALAAYRRKLGLPATSLAWGIWDHGTEMGEQLGTDRLAEVIRTGFRPISADYGLDVLEACLQTPDETNAALLLPANFDVRKIASASPAGLFANLTKKEAVPPQRRSVIEEYDALDHHQRHGFLLRFVTDLVCKVLRNPDPQSIAPDAEFRTLGFDSLTSIEMTGELSEATALSLPATAVFDHPTPRTLASFLQTQLEARQPKAGFGKTVEKLAEALGPEPSGPEPSGIESFGRLMQTAIVQGRTKEGRAVLKGAAAFRPSFAASDSKAVTPRLAWLNHTGDAPLLICLNSFIPSVGDYTYRRLANALTGQFDVAAIALPGYADGEPLPQDIEAFGEVMAQAVHACAGARPFTLAGFSTGGLAVHATAAHLENTRSEPTSLVLIDTFHPRVMTDEAMESALTEWSSAAGSLMAQNDAGFTAMAWYLDLFLEQWAPAKLKTPLCLIQAESGLADTVPEHWASAWEPLASRVTVPGRHFTLLREDVGHTAAILTEMARKDHRTNRLKSAS